MCVLGRYIYMERNEQLCSLSLSLSLSLLLVLLLCANSVAPFDWQCGFSGWLATSSAVALCDSVLV